MNHELIAALCKHPKEFIVHLRINNNPQELFCKRCRKIKTVGWRWMKISELKYGYTKWKEQEEK